jgi:hypothetical protein
MKTAFTVFVLYLCLASAALAQNPYGIDRRQLAEPYVGNRMPQSAPLGYKGPMPMLLSQTGVFETTSNLIPAKPLIPYDVNSALWSDSAKKYRWMYIPKTPVTFTSNYWTFPPGSVFVKHFELTNAAGSGNSRVTRRLETRLLVVDAASQVYGVTYIWKPDNSDAVLAPEDGATSNIVVVTSSGTSTQAWAFPSRAQCNECHTKETGGVLGVKTPQLNGTMTYPNADASSGTYSSPTGVADNQLRTLAHIGLFTPASTPAEASIPGLPRMAGLTDTTANLETRARSYLDANCAHCHQPAGEGRFDARFMTPFASQGLPNTGKLKFHQSDNSSINNRDADDMPPVGRNLVDTNWIPFLTNWINTAFNAVSAGSTVSNQVTVTFNGNPDGPSGTNLANYVLAKNDDSATYTLTKAVLSGNIVTLTVSAPLPATTALKLTVNNVLDQLSPQDRTWPNRVLNFNTPASSPSQDDENGPPPNDNFSLALTLTGTSATGSANNCNGTKESGEPNHAGNPGGASVWWNWTAPTNGYVSIDTFGSDFDTLLAVYTGSSVASLTPIVSNDDFSDDVIGAPINLANQQASQVSFTAVQGTTYRIAVDGNFDGYNLACGTVVLNLSQAPPPQGPPNDFFTNALVLTGTSGSTTGSNFFATKEPGEPVVAGNAGGASVWWAWTAPADGNVQIDTHGSSIDTILGVFIGTNVSALTTVAQNDDDEANNVTTSLVQFAAASGVTYYISVDGYAGAYGNIALNYAFTPSALSLLPVVTLQPLLSTDGQLVMELDGPAGGVVNLQASSDLNHWTSIGTYILSGNSLRVSDSISNSNQQRFYRAVRYLEPPPGQ